jgi:hypothetical protein
MMNKIKGSKKCSIPSRRRNGLTAAVGRGALGWFLSGQKAANIAAGSKEPNKTKVGKSNSQTGHGHRENQVETFECARRRSPLFASSRARPGKWAWKSSIKVDNQL